MNTMLSKRTGMILNLVFAINWFFLIFVFIYLQRSKAVLSGFLLIFSIILPLLTLCLIALYIWLNIGIIQSIKTDQEKYKKAKFFLLLISILGTLTVLTTMLILLATSGKLLVLSIVLSIGISGVLGIAAIIIDTFYFINRLKWNNLLNLSNVSKKENSSQSKETIV